MKAEISQRFDYLIHEGETLEGNIKFDTHGNPFYIPKRNVSTYQAWISSAANLINACMPRGSYHADEIKRLATHEHRKTGLPTGVFTEMLGLLVSAKNEWTAGLATKIEYIYVAETFDDFLDHAAKYHKLKKITESSVLASVVFEDTIKKIAAKNLISTKDKTLDPLIEDLVKGDVFTKLRAKRAKGLAGVRNLALHANWKDINLGDVGSMITETRELIDEFLG